MGNLTTLKSLSEVASQTSNDVLSDFLKLKISTNTRQTYSKALGDSVDVSGTNTGCWN